MTVMSPTATVAMFARDKDLKRKFWKHKLYLVEDDHLTILCGLRRRVVDVVRHRIGPCTDSKLGFPIKGTAALPTSRVELNNVHVSQVVSLHKASGTRKSIGSM